ncbi:SH3 domain-containing protein [Dendryphion nanum]|uniref:SH3 domain-containing protein n=1 Tax=Dendryphion nanum TaxID=256645 RepID=A0A9P9EDP1_9PLEO|nr:SH3 domain-containing protein [Dendryphion nanum]
MSNTPQPESPPRPVRVKARYAFVPERDTELRLNPGDELVVLHVERSGWLYGTCEASGSSGWFPMSYTYDVEE